MTAKKAVQMIREQIEAEVRADKQDADYLQSVGQHERGERCRIRIAALSRALCCVRDVERQLH